MTATIALPGTCGAVTRAAACTLPAGHPGPHRAEGYGGRLFEEWVEPASVFAIRYTHGTDLANRWPEPTESTWATREEAEDVRRYCANAASMEIVEIPLNQAGAA